MLNKFSTLKVSFFLLIVGGFTFGSLASASELTHTTIINHKDDNLLVRYGTLEQQNFYLCQISTEDCQNLGSTTKPEISNLFKEEKTLAERLKNITFNRSKATRLLLSPDDRWLTYFEPSLAKEKNPRKFVLLDLQTEGSTREKSFNYEINYWDLLSEELRIFNFSPDSRSLVYLDDKTGYSTLYFVDLDQKDVKLPGQQLITRKYSVADFLLWTDEILYFSANREGVYNWSLYRYNLKTKDLQKVADNISYNQQMRRVGAKGQEQLLFTQIINNSAVPARLDPITNKIKYFSTFATKPQTPSYQEEFIKLGTASGVLLRPESYTKGKHYPLIIWLHGGPYRQSSLGRHSYLGYAIYDWLLGEMAKSGALVLKLDYRGSYGFGRDWAEALKGEVGRADVSDVLMAESELKKNYLITKTYLAGNSYGAYLALRTIVDNKAQGRFSGALAINGVTDWFVLLQSLENSIFNVQFDGLLDEKNSLLYYQADIADRVKNLTKQRIIIAHAEKDSTIPVSQADYLARIFALRKKPLEVVKYKDEDHVPKKISTMEDLCRQLASLANLKTTCRW